MDKEQFLGLDISKVHAVIHADNMAVLKAMKDKFHKCVDCIYIDPPYNNGESYNYYIDNVSHEEWLESMETVLKLLWLILKDNGSLWISIDDGEMHYLKVLCDKIFGRDKFITTIIWQQRNTRENRKIFSNNHEYLLVFSPNPALFKKKRNLLPITDEILSRYSNPDNDPRGLWQSITANVQAGHAVPSQFYEITAPNGKKHNPPQGRCWVYNQQRMEREIAEGNIWFGSDGNGVPRIKKFISNSVKGVVPETLWLPDFAGTNKDAKTHLQKLQVYNKDLFETPKPESLIAKILEIATSEGDLVLDCFLGSGTTVSTAHKMSRNYIGIEKNLETCLSIVARMDKVVTGEKGGISSAVKWNGGGTYDYIEWNGEGDAEGGLFCNMQEYGRR